MKNDKKSLVEVRVPGFGEFSVEESGVMRLDASVPGADGQGIPVRLQGRIAMPQNPLARALVSGFAATLGALAPKK